VTLTVLYTFYFKYYLKVTTPALLERSFRLYRPPLQSNVAITYTYDFYCRHFFYMGYRAEFGRC